MPLSFIKPNEILAPYIDRYWLFDNTESTVSFASQIPPGVGVDLFLHYSEPFMLENNAKLPQSHIIFSGQTSTQILSLNNVHFIAIRFKAAALKNFTNVPLHELLEIHATVENIWGVSGKNLVARIKSINERNEAIEQLEIFLEEKLKTHKKDTLVWNDIVQKLYRHYDSVTIDALAKKMNITNRHFRRKFTEETGFAPKHFQQLARFHSTIKPLLLKKDKRYLSAALNNGYFDQTHFIKEFRHFMNCTPSQFLQDKNFMSHFYYPSIIR
jgi:AraC-like DNA-binding protein